jgi:class 3 adenylate cyclase
MGFGLHVGWAIEGAIGSMKKIDASYLSPHVNLAARLESACEQFQVDILISAHFYRMLSPHVRDLCRRLDRVKVSLVGHHILPLALIIE